MGKFENLVIRIRMCPALAEKGRAKMQGKTQQHYARGDNRLRKKGCPTHRATAPVANTGVRKTWQQGSTLIAQTIEMDAKNTTLKVGTHEGQSMLTGIVLLLAGILIALYPPLLSIIVASVLIALGLLLAVSAWHHRRRRRGGDNPIIELILRY